MGQPPENLAVGKLFADRRPVADFHLIAQDVSRRDRFIRPGVILAFRSAGNISNPWAAVDGGAARDITALGSTIVVIIFPAPCRLLLMRGNAPPAAAAHFRGGAGRF